MPTTPAHRTRLDPRDFDGTDIGLGYGVPGGSITEILASVQDVLIEPEDIEIPIDILVGTGDAGTWTKAITSTGLPTVTRTAGAGTQGYWLALDEAAKIAADRGLEITGARVSYSVGTADATDVRAEIYKGTTPADNVAPVAPTVVGGQTNSHYDAAHDTAAERGDDTTAPEYHTATVTLPTPAITATKERFHLKFVVVDPGTSVVVLRAVTILAKEIVTP